jgi:hypothetical protein
MNMSWHCIPTMAAAAITGIITTITLKKAE